MKEKLILNIREALKIWKEKGVQGRGAH